MQKVITKAEFRAKLKDYLDELEAGVVLDVAGLQICKYVHNDVQPGAPVHTSVQADVQIDYEKLAKLIVKGINDVQAAISVVPSQPQSFNKQESFNQLKETLGVTTLGKEEVKTCKCESCGKPTNEPREVEKSKMFGDYGLDGWMVVCPKCVGPHPNRPYVEEEKIELPMYDLGLSMNNRATTMNDGSNPIPKPVKKKKNEK